MRELKLGEQLMPTPLATTQVWTCTRARALPVVNKISPMQVHFDWESRIQREQIKISEIFSKVRLVAGTGVLDFETRTLTVSSLIRRTAIGRTRHLLLGGEGHVHQEGAKASDVWHDTLPRAQLEDIPQRSLPYRRQLIGSTSAAAHT